MVDGLSGCLAAVWHRGKAMDRKLRMVSAVGIGLALATAMSPALAFGPIARSVTGQRDLLDVSFWARPFPHGYTGWGPCIRVSLRLRPPCWVSFIDV